MVNTEGFMEYIVELIDNMASKTADHLRANPLVIAHCIGAMKIITAISIAQESHVIMNCFLVTQVIIIIIHVSLSSSGPYSTVWPAKFKSLF